MAVSKLSSIIFFFLFIIFSLFVDENAFAAQMEHRKLGAPKETVTMRRNLEGNGNNGSKIAATRSNSKHDGQKYTDKEPSKAKPDQATTQGQRHYLSYETLKGKGVVIPHPSNCTYYSLCKPSVP